MNKQEVTSISLDALRQAVKVMTTEAKPTSATLTAIVEIRRLIEVIDTAHATHLIKQYLVEATMKHYGVMDRYEAGDDSLADEMTDRLKRDTAETGLHCGETFDMLIRLAEAGRYEEAIEFIDDLFKVLRAQRELIAKPKTKRKVTR